MSLLCVTLKVQNFLDEKEEDDSTLKNEVWIFELAFFVNILKYLYE